MREKLEQKEGSRKRERDHEDSFESFKKACFELEPYGNTKKFNEIDEKITDLIDTDFNLYNPLINRNLVQAEARVLNQIQKINELNNEINEFKRFNFNYQKLDKLDTIYSEFLKIHNYISNLQLIELDQMRSLYFKDVFPSQYKKKEIKGNSEKAILQREFCEFAIENNWEAFDKFSPFLAKKNSHLSNLKPYVFLLAVDHGSYEATHLLLDEGDIPTNEIIDACALAFEKGYYPIFNLLYFSILKNRYLLDAKKPFDMALHFIIFLAVQQGAKSLLDYVLANYSFDKQFLLFSMKEILASKNPRSFNWLLEFFPLDDAEILENIKGNGDFFLENPDSYYGILATKPYQYTINVFENINRDPLTIEKVMNDEGKTITLSFCEDQFILGLNCKTAYREFLIANPTSKILIKKILANYNGENSINVASWMNRHLSFLLVSLDAMVPLEFDPEILFYIIFNTRRAYYPEKVELFNLLLQNKFFDLSVDNYQFLRLFVEEYSRIHSIHDYLYISNFKKLGNWIPELFSNYHVNRIEAYQHLDTQVRAVLLVLRMGLGSVLPILFECWKNGETLSEIFLKYPKLIQEALEEGINSNPDLLTTISSLLFFSTLERSTKYIDSFFMDYNKNNLCKSLKRYFLIYSSNHSMLLANYINELTIYTFSLYKPVTESKEFLSFLERENSSLIQILLSSVEIYKSKTKDEWKLFFVQFKEAGYCISEKLCNDPNYLDTSAVWSKIKPLRELRNNPLKFFYSIDRAVPDDIFDQIELSYSNLFR